MEFPLVGLNEANSSNATAAAAEHVSLYGRKPLVAGLYVGVLGVAAVVGTLGNLAVISAVTVKQIRRRRTTGNDVGRAFIANLALSDLVVTSVINPLAIAGASYHVAPRLELCLHRMRCHAVPRGSRYRNATHRIQCERALLLTETPSVRSVVYLLYKQVVQPIHKKIKPVKFKHKLTW